MSTILVDVDGSESSGVALEFAAEETALRGASLKVVSVWEASPRAQEECRPVPEEFANRQRIAEEIVGEAVARVKGLQPHLPCWGAVRYGRSQTVLVDEARDAALLVVGRRGQEGLAFLLLGSVSWYVVNKSSCPVVVVPPLVR